MASGHALSCGINWSEAVCIEYHVSIGVDPRDPSVEGRNATD